MKIHADTFGLRRIYCHLIFFVVVNNHLYVPIANNQEKKLRTRAHFEMHEVKSERKQK